MISRKPVGKERSYSWPGATVAAAQQCAAMPDAANKFFAWSELQSADQPGKEVIS